LALGASDGPLPWASALMKSSILDFLLCCGGEGALCSSLPWAFSSFSRFFMKAS